MRSREELEKQEALLKAERAHSGYDSVEGKIQYHADSLQGGIPTGNLISASGLLRQRAHRMRTYAESLDLLAVAIEKGLCQSDQHRLMPTLLEAFGPTRPV